MILALDLGTTSVRALLIGVDGGCLGVAQQEFRQIFPQPGWVSHDANEIWEVTCQVIRRALEHAQRDAGEIAAIGIANQRETAVLWERGSGAPVHHAIVWQCRRTADICRRYREAGLAGLVAERTGLVIDPYFSATKIVWLLENVPGLRGRAEAGEICFGTVDSYILFRLTQGAVHATDPTNASRTMCYNIHRLEWDRDLLAAFGIPAAILPGVLPSAGSFGLTAAGPLPTGIPITGIAGDQQAALYGQNGVAVGDIKNTYGTGCFTLFQTGEEAVASRHGLLTTVACGPSGQTSYALEGSVFSAGSAVQWLRDGLRIIDSAPESEALARSVENTGGVYLVPAFTGLGAPYWDPDVRGTLVGITRGTERAHVVRATLEAIAYQTVDLVAAMRADAAHEVRALRADGGAAANDFLMQFQADILGVPVIRPRSTETTALGAAMLAGLAVGFWKTPADLADLNPPERTLEPQWSQDRREALLDGWHKAVATARHRATLD
jgi:glycerol kinase